MTTTSPLRQTFLILRCQWQSARTVIFEAFKTSRLMVAIVTLFILSYQIVGWWLFQKGLGYIQALPGIGTLLEERILYLIFFLFFVMLIFSNCALLFVGAFRSKQTSWLLSLPIQPQAIFAGRLAESLTFSSWGLIILSAPILLAYGSIHDASLGFYLKSLPLILIFISFPAALAGMVVLLVARWWPNGGKGILPILLVVAGFMTWKAVSIVPSEIFDSEVASAQIAIGDYLRHTEIATSPLLPSAWVSQALLGWLGIIPKAASWFHFLLTLSYSLMGLLVVSGIAKRCYFSGWSRNSRRSSRRTDGLPDFSSRNPLPPGELRRNFALLHRDARTFVRDPSQWIQGVVVVGLLIVYIFNIRNMGYDFDNPLWHAVICYLNFTVCALALSTLTTRFVYPQFSQEGQRLWIVGMAPFPTQRLLWLKLFQSVVMTSLTAAVLMLLSGHVLELGASRTAAMAVAMLLLCTGLNSLSAGLGTLFPNFYENNPAKMVSGFGGTLCLVASFALIITTVVALALPDILLLSRGGKPPAHGFQLTQPMTLGVIALVVAATCSAVLIPAARKIKRLDYLRIP